MRSSILFALAATTSCTEAARAPEAVVRSRALEADPIVVALAHFVERQDLHVSMPRDPVGRDVLLVRPRFTTHRPAAYVERIADEFLDVSWTDREEMARDARVQLGAVVAIDALAAVPFVRIADGRIDFPRRLDPFPEQPDAKCVIELWPPLYTSDGCRALVRFFFEPTAHGALATYVLEFRDSAWRVVRSRLAYYG